MSDIPAEASEMSGHGPEGTRPAHAPRFGLFPVLAGYGLAMVALLAAIHHMSGLDYVGLDNDDAMRLVEVRDLLAGQGWFDMMQYRLGLAGGTLMHWSRFVDLPIALLIRFFSLFAAPERAEALALAVWPLSLSFAIVCLMGLAAYRAAGTAAMHVAAGITILYVYSMGRFMPGSADHHNVQLTLATLLLAMLVDPRRRVSSFVLAGMAAGLEIAIGAEAVPFVAAACAVVACLWAWHGDPLRKPAMAFGLSLLFTVSLAFFLTVPPRLYAMVTCDSLSLGFYSLSGIGAFLLFLSAATASGSPRIVRFGALAGTGAAVLAAAIVIAPECLGNPLANLDPMLAELWLNKVIEAHSFIEKWREEPTSVGGFYAVGLLALLVSLARLIRREKVELHLVILPLLGISVAVAAVQVRGAMFSNLLAILPMAVLAADLRVWQQEKPESSVRSAAYLGSILCAMPLVWSIAGLIVEKGVSGLTDQLEAPRPSGPMACGARTTLQPLADLPKGVVLAPSDLGAPILRYTAHRVLSAPYHRNQAGMLTELNTGLAMPDEAIAFLRGAGVTYVLFCPGEYQTADLARLKPEGFYGSLTAGKVPAYLVPVNRPAKGALQIYRVVE